MQDPLTLEAAASAVQTGYDDAVRADQHRVPAEGETVTHSLATGGAVAEQSREEGESAGLRAESFFSLHTELLLSLLSTLSRASHTQFLQTKT